MSKKKDPTEAPEQNGEAEEEEPEPGFDLEDLDIEDLSDEEIADLEAEITAAKTRAERAEVLEQVVRKAKEPKTAGEKLKAWLNKDV